jgi:hypothetical protein
MDGSEILEKKDIIDININVLAISLINNINNNDNIYKYDDVVDDDE